MTKWMAYLASDIIGDLTFSRKFNMMESETNRNIPEIIAQGLGGLNLVSRPSGLDYVADTFRAGYMPMILTLGLDQVLFQKLNKAKQQFQDLSKGQSGWRIKEKELQTRDLFANLLAAKDPESLKGFTEEEFIAESGILIVAGADTVATTMAANLFYCLHYPSALRRLQSEIRDAFADSEAVRTGEQMNSCHFLRACLNETMRLTPPVSALLPREILVRGLIVDGR